VSLLRRPPLSGFGRKQIESVRVYNLRPTMIADWHVTAGSADPISQMVHWCVAGAALGDAACESTFSK
jgi:hypothetical protein